MLEEKTLFVMKTDKEQKLLDKFVAIANPVEGKEIGINDLLNSNQFSEEEHKDLRRLFKGDYKNIRTKDFNLYAMGDQWIYEQSEVVNNKGVYRLK